MGKILILDGISASDFSTMLAFFYIIDRFLKFYESRGLHLVVESAA
jgi:hypothetical protein